MFLTLDYFLKHLEKTDLQNPPNVSRTKVHLTGQIYVHLTIIG